MTVRVVVTASGRATFQGSGYAPARRRRARRRRADRRCASSRAGARARGRRPREQRERTAAGRTVDDPGRSDGRRAIGGGPQVRPQSRGARPAATAHRRGAVLVGAKADEHAPPPHRAAGPHDRVHQGRAGRVARALHLRVGGRRPPSADHSAARPRSCRPTKRSPARRCGRSAWPRNGCRTERRPDADDRVEQDLVFAGLIGMIDPPRAEAREAVSRAKGAGIRPLMITGDHPRTAAVIAQELGISTDGRALTGAELEKMPPPPPAGRLSPRSPCMRASTPNTSCGSSTPCVNRAQSSR